MSPDGRRPHLILRADASARIGMGHVLRCLTLGEALVSRGWDVSLATANAPAGVVPSAQVAGVRIIPVEVDAGSAVDAAALIERADRAPDGPTLVLVDGYQFEVGFFRVLDEAGQRHVVIDDTGRTTAIAPDLIVDQNPSAAPDQYARFGGRTTLRLGLDYALVRRSILDRAHRVDAPGADGAPARDAGRVLVTMGGSDPLGLSAPVATALAHRGIATTVVLGPATADASAVADHLASRPSVEVASPAAFEDLLAGATVAVVGAGTTMWEGACLGTPMVAVVVADNQATPAAAAATRGFVEVIEGRPDRAGLGCAERVGDTVAALLADDDRRASLGRHGRAAVDGRGAERVADALANLFATRED
jgi:UDP-2,4-diacetamido-2,4,6-trideoxy-beta-L-altropyranose hydrolase